jgi:hypothetical protein
VADYGPDDIAAAIRRLNRAGWSVGSTAFATEAGGLAWVVSGVNGENRVEGRGATAEEAWGPRRDADRDASISVLSGTKHPTVRRISGAQLNTTTMISRNTPGSETLIGKRMAAP